MTRLAAWWRYRRRLAALAGEHLGNGCAVSPALYGQLREQAWAHRHERRVRVELRIVETVSPETEKGA